MTSSRSAGFEEHRIACKLGVLVVALSWAACGMRSPLEMAAVNGDENGGASGGVPGAGGAGGVASSGGSRKSDAGVAGGRGGSRAGGSGAGGVASGGGTSFASGGRGGGGGVRASGGSRGVRSTGGRGGSGGSAGAGGASSIRRDGSAGAGGDPSPDVPPVGIPVIDPDSGHTVVNAGTVIMSGNTSCTTAGSGSMCGIVYYPDSFCVSGTVGASVSYSSWAVASFNVNQPSGASGSTSQLVLEGTSITVSYVNEGGSRLELQLWDGSRYWCTYLPVSKVPTTQTIPFAKLNSQCWDGKGEVFQSGTAITTVQLLVPGDAEKSTPFDYCFLGITVQ